MIANIVQYQLTTLLAAGYYLAAVYLIGFSFPATLAQYFGHALLFVASIALISSMRFISEKLRSKKREEACSSEAVPLPENR